MTTTKHSPKREITLMLEHAVRKHFAPKHRIMDEGANSDVLYYVLSGSVTVLVEDSNGEELILAYLGPGEFFGELGLFDTDTRRSATVRARTECDVAIITYDKFRSLIQTIPGLLLPLVGQISQRLRSANRKLGDLAFVDVAGRIARALLELAADSQAITHPDGILVRITRDELGRLVNCSRQMAGYVLQELEQQGLIQVHGKNIVVHRIAEAVTLPAHPDAVSEGSEVSSS